MVVSEGVMFSSVDALNEKCGGVFWNSTVTRHWQSCLEKPLYEMEKHDMFIFGGT